MVEWMYSVPFPRKIQSFYFYPPTLSEHSTHSVYVTHCMALHGSKTTCMSQFHISGKYGKYGYVQRPFICIYLQYLITKQNGFIHSIYIYRCSWYLRLSPRGGGGLQYVCMVGKFSGDDPVFWDFISERVHILCIHTIWLTPSFCRKIRLSLEHLGPEIFWPACCIKCILDFRSNWSLSS